MNNKYRKLISPILIIILFATILYLPMVKFEAPEIENSQSLEELNKDNEWIIKWKGNYDEKILEQAVLLDWLPDLNIMRLKLNEGIEPQKWLSKWENNSEIVYIQPNSTYKVSQTPNDIHYPKQSYLQQIRAEAGWEQDSSNKVTVAILDTGIDLNHPDLKPNLVQGINLLDKNLPPQDDNGHGTNVAGIVGAAGNNIIGVSGITWKSDIMPIKVLDHEGVGKSFFIGQGVRYAVDNGAKVVLLALGDSVNTPFMREAIDYAESKDVLVVAASGNDSSLLNYPAAYSNVLSVGAVNSYDNYVPYSNYGQQLDVVAPGEGIFTTKLGGDYMTNSGTSMAAPQVAGLAALIFQKYPQLAPSEVIDLIKFTADDVGAPGLDELTGYGRINIEKALTTPLYILNDGYENNQSIRDAHFFPLEDTFNAQLSMHDVDWYKIRLPYKGTVKLTIEFDHPLEQDLEIEVLGEDQIPVEQQFPLENSRKRLSGNENPINNNNDQNNQGNATTQTDEETTEIEQTENTTENKGTIYTITGNNTIAMELPEGTTYIGIRNSINQQGFSDIQTINYRLTNSFRLYNDLYEPNNDPWSAYHIENLNMPIIGTINKDGDSDWYKVRINQKGVLTTVVNVDSLRFDPVLAIKPANNVEEVFDYHGSGREEFGYINVEPGTYLIKVSDYNNYHVLGEYNLNFRFKPETGDTNEPNDMSLQAIPVEFPEKTYQGRLINSQDNDWYELMIENDSYLAFDFTADKDTDVSLLDNNLNSLWTETSIDWTKGSVLKPGKYYLRLRSPNSENNYTLLIKQLDLLGGYTDIADHWAKESIIKLTEEGLIKGFDDYTFRPNESITRGDVALTLSKLFDFPKPESGLLSFSDVQEGTELYDAVSEIYYNGIMTGYDNNSFKPEQPIKRDQLIIILTRAFDIPINYGLGQAYPDVTKDNFAYYQINTFYNYGLLNNFGTDHFNPEKFVSRAEFASLLDGLNNNFKNQEQSN